MSKRAIAISAHPDDIELMMAGTLLLLKETGYEIHYMTIANGSCGTAVHTKEQIIEMRGRESRNACDYVGAIYHPPICDDLEIYYDRILVSKVSAVIRQVDPEIVLLQSPQDYMEDHMNSVRIGVTATFCRNMQNFVTDPPTPAVETDVAVYHALPYGLKDQLRNTIHPDFFVDISSVLKTKREMLACHKSQKEWLDHSQGLDSYLITMEEMSAQVGELSGKFNYAEGWRRHSHLGYGPEDFDPLTQALAKYVRVKK
ncbi:MAG: LmbE family protein [Phycisphaerae bacterium]|nr:LmbE family protein [Phycisphaerae bacterium]